MDRRATQVLFGALLVFGCVLLYDSAVVYLIRKVIGPRGSLGFDPFGFDVKEFAIGLTAAAVGAYSLWRVRSADRNTSGLIAGLVVLSLFVPLSLSLELHDARWFTQNSHYQAVGTNDGFRKLRQRYVQYAPAEPVRLQAPKNSVSEVGDSSVITALKDVRGTITTPGHTNDRQGRAEEAARNALEAQRRRIEELRQIHEQDANAGTPATALVDAKLTGEKLTQIIDAPVQNLGAESPSRQYGPTPAAEALGVFDTVSACGGDPVPDSESTRLFEAAAGSGLNFEFKPGAEEMLLRAIDIDPKNYLAYDRLSIYYQNEKRDSRAAISILDQSLSEMPGCASAHFTVARLHSGAGRYDNAIDHLVDAIRLTPEPPASYHYNLGNAYLKRGMPEQAADQYRQAQKIDPAHTKSYKNLAHAYMQLREFDELLILQAGNADHLRRVGVTLSRQDDKRQAIRFYEASLALEGDADTYYNLAVAYAQLDQFDKSRIAANKALEMRPRHDGAVTVIRLLDKQ